MSQSIRVNHTVIASHRTDQHTEMLRELVTLLGGVTRAAKALESTRDEVAEWTIKGLPARHRKAVKALHEIHKGSFQKGHAQDPSYTEGTLFPLNRGR